MSLDSFANDARGYLLKYFPDVCEQQAEGDYAVFEVEAKSGTARSPRYGVIQGGVLNYLREITLRNNCGGETLTCCH